VAATYKDIQKMTGLSLSTISKYFNGGNVRPDNAEAIKRAASELDYRVNSFAQSLRTQKSKTVGVLLPDLTNTFHAQIISGVSLDLMHAGYGVIVGSFGESEESMDDAVEFLLSKMVDGLVVVPTAAGRLPVALQSASNGHPPVVVLDRTP
jgi:DNA-binding LacI/PurR family transcriptional regulator